MKKRNVSVVRASPLEARAFTRYFQTSAIAEISYPHIGWWWRRRQIRRGVKEEQAQAHAETPYYYLLRQFLMIKAQTCGRFYLFFPVKLSFDLETEG